MREGDSEMNLKALIVTGLAAASITVAAQEKMVMVGGESMLPSKNIVATATFAKLPAGTVESLLKPENKSTLTKVLTYHVVTSVLMPR